MNNIWLAFITGLTTGGVSCLAVQGGLLTSAVSKDKQSNSRIMSHLGEVGIFLLAKILSYAILGALLGGLGSMLVLTPKILGLVQIAAGIFMVLTALRLADVHPIFRYFVMTPPKWSYKLLRKTSKSTSGFAPFLLGFCTILMPCGVTQAMMTVAVGTGSPLLGALVMGAFVVGTSPIFFLLGATVIELLQRKYFAYIAALIVAIFGFVSINGGLVARGSIYTFQNAQKLIEGDYSILDKEESVSHALPKISNGVQEATITVSNGGYESDITELKMGVPVELKLVTNNVRSCALAFTIPDYNIRKILPSTGVTEITFTPNKAGRLAYSCSMGMYGGEFRIIQ